MKLFKLNILLKKSFIFTSYLLAVIGCEFIHEPFEVPADEYSAGFYIEPGDTMTIALANILSDECILTPEISIQENETSVDILAAEADSVTVVGLDEGTSIIEIKGKTIRNRFIIFAEITVISGQPLFLKMGETTGLSPVALFNTTGEFPDSITYEVLTESDQPTIEYIQNDTLLIKGNFPGEAVMVLTGHFDEVTVDVRLNVFTEIRHVVLGELFTSTTCTNCPEANEAVTEYLSNYSESLAVIRYHLGTPAPGDPMYEYNMDDADYRRSLYMFFEIAPFFTVDGGSPFVGVGQIETAASASIIERIEQPASVYIGHQVENGESLNVLIHVWGSEDLTQYNLLAALVENEVYFEGSNGETHHYEVMRDITELSIIEGQDIFELTLNKPSWYEEEQFTVITFLQDKSTHEIIQANIHHKPYLVNDYVN